MDNEENILFEQMPDFQSDWGQMVKPKPNVETEVQVVESVEKEYATLYDELFDKCNPNQFAIETFGLEKFQVANKIYAQLIQLGKGMSDSDIIILRNRAIDELGIHISTKKKFDELESLFDTKQYVNKQPYDEELVSKAAILYNQLLENRDDIRALEKLEKNPDVECVKDEYDYMILEADKYLEKHPKGKYSDKIKKELFEKEEYYYNSMAAEVYLEKYPNGIFASQARERIRQEFEEAQRQREEELIRIKQNKEEISFYDESAKDYLKKYPEGRFSQEARCFMNNKLRYLKAYPNGRYKSDIYDIVVLVLVVLFCLPILIWLLVYLIHR